jgi:NADH:ubiquinone oxidoreductase subunit 5 (subunit L)/multisubunit Na+/H+ antiporter MnhA subunit
MAERPSWTKVTAGMAMLGMLLGSAMALAGCEWKTQTRTVEARPVRTITAAKGGSGETVMLTGQIGAEKETSLSFRMGGRIIERLADVGDRVEPDQVLARLASLIFLLAGLALIGPPTSGVYLAKTLLLAAAYDTRQWWWALVLQAGGILTSSYLVLVVAYALAPSSGPAKSPAAAIPYYRQVAALGLVLCSLSLGLVPWQKWLPLLVRGIEPGPLGLDALWSMVWPILIGVLVAMAFGRWGSHRPWRVAAWLERADITLREWPAAGLSLLVVAIAFMAAMV